MVDGDHVRVPESREPRLHPQARGSLLGINPQCSSSQGCRSISEVCPVCWSLVLIAEPSLSSLPGSRPSIAGEVSRIGVDSAAAVEGRAGRWWSRLRLGGWRGIRWLSCSPGRRCELSRPKDAGLPRPDRTLEATW